MKRKHMNLNVYKSGWFRDSSKSVMWFDIRVFGQSTVCSQKEWKKSGNAWHPRL